MTEWHEPRAHRGTLRWIGTGRLQAHPRVARIVAGGKALAGECWQSALSRATGVSQSYLAMITTGERPITDIGA